MIDAHFRGYRTYWKFFHVPGSNDLCRLEAVMNMVMLLLLNMKNYERLLSLHIHWLNSLHHFYKCYTVLKTFLELPSGFFLPVAPDRTPNVSFLKSFADVWMTGISPPKGNKSDFCNVHNTVLAILKALNVPKINGEVFNTSGVPVSIREMIQKVCSLTGSGIPSMGKYHIVQGKTCLYTQIFQSETNVAMGTYDFIGQRTPRNKRLLCLRA